ncbi:MAG: hypothetical protein AAF609_03870 [Cyanobacteria bacterium P01_C01_bin.120]
MPQFFVQAIVSAYADSMSGELCPAASALSRDANIFKPKVGTLNLRPRNCDRDTLGQDEKGNTSP